MLNRSTLQKCKPLLFFFLLYTALFLLFKETFLYTFPFLVGFIIAYLARRPIRFFRRRFHMRNKLASALITAVIILCIFALLITLVWVTVRESVSIFSWFTADQFAKPLALVDMLGEKVDQLFGKNFWQRTIDTLTGTILSAAGVFSTLMNVAKNTVSSIPTILTWLMVAVFASFVFSCHMDTILQFIRDFFTEKALGHLNFAVKSTGSSGKKSFFSYAFLYFIAFCESLIITCILGVDYPVVVSLIMCVADILPVLGPGLVYIPLAAFYLLTGHYGVAIGLVIGYILITVTREIAEPKLVAESTKIHPLWAIAAVYFSLIAKNFWVMLYVMGLCMFYGLFRESGALPALVPPGSEEEDGKEAPSAPPPPSL